MGAEAGDLVPRPTDVGVAQPPRSALPLAEGLSHLLEARSRIGRTMRSVAGGDGLGIARQLSTALHLKPIRSMTGASRTLGPLSAGGIALGLRGQPPASALTEIPGPGSSATKSAQFRKGAINGSGSILVNFSPTVVLQGGVESGELERRVVEAIGRHSHELIRIVSRELQSQRRAAF